MIFDAEIEEKDIPDHTFAVDTPENYQYFV